MTKPTRPRPTPKPKPTKSEATREHILEAALALFRKRGFDKTTMRDVAVAGGVATGAAYYYFPSKAAIVLAYYQRLQREHVAVAAAALADTRGLRPRLGVVFHTKLDLFARDRKLLGALWRSGGAPGDPDWVFGADTRSVRNDNIAVYAAALVDEPLPADLRALLPPLLWLINLGVLLFYVNDRSPRQERTRRLVDGTLDLVVQVALLVGMPGLEAMRGQAMALLAEAGLVEPA